MTMASQCKKVKNPCKICLANVTHKSGIRCEGVCRSWVHYKCLNFTPGKISDIKRGLIIVNCPCPDCTTDLPKEMTKDEPFSCTNAYCPANLPPKCINSQCPSNATRAPPGHNSLLASPQRMRPVPQFAPCTVDNCNSSKVSPTHRQFKFSNQNKSVSPPGSCCSGGDVKKVECVTQTPCPLPPSPPPLCLPPPCLPLPCPPPQYPPPQCPPPPCPQRPKCKHKNKEAAKKNTAAIKAMERMCSTMGQLTCQLNTLMDKMQQALTMPMCPPPCPPQRPCSPLPAYHMPSSQTNTCSLTELPCCCPGGGQQSGINDQQSYSSSLSPPCCLQDQQDSNTGYDSQPACFCPTNPLRRDNFYSN